MARNSLSVLLINPTFSLYKIGWPPLGLAYLAAALRESGHGVRILDPTPLREEASAVTPDFVPDLVGISVVTSLRGPAHQFAEKIKRDLAIPVVVGGPDVTSCSEEHMKHPAVDYAVVGEGERTIVELADRLGAGEPVDDVHGLVWKRDGEVVANPPRALMENVDEAPLPARDLLDVAWYRQSLSIRGTAYRGTTLMTARGCPWKCTFCDSRRTWSQRYRPHSVDRVVEEMLVLLRDYKARNFQFLDDTFPVDRERTLELCGVFAEHMQGIRWACQARVDRIDDEVVAAMKAGGCVQLEFGVESGSDRVLEQMNKGFTTEQIRAAFEVCRKHEVRTYANFILGTPRETVEDVRATFRLYQEIKPNASDLWVATPYPGTDLHAYCVEHGLLADDYQTLLLHHGHELGGHCFVRSEMSREEMHGLTEEFYTRVRQDWDYEPA